MKKRWYILALLLVVAAIALWLSIPQLQSWTDDLQAHKTDAEQIQEPEAGQIQKPEAEEPEAKEPEAEQMQEPEAGQAQEPKTESQKTDQERKSKAYQAIITWWSDGDTIKIKNGSHVRLILIDCPESVNPDAGKNEADGSSASAWVRENFPVPYKVWLTFDVESTDKFDRKLAYVWDVDPTGHTTDEAFVRAHMLNARILASGHAKVLHIKPNGAQYIDLFRRIEREASQDAK